MGCGRRENVRDTNSLRIIKRGEGASGSRNLVWQRTLARHLFKSFCSKNYPECTELSSIMDCVLKYVPD